MPVSHTHNSMPGAPSICVPDILNSIEPVKVYLTALVSRFIASSVSLARSVKISVRASPSRTQYHLEVGSWVVGFFRDGSSAQDPMVMGSVATQTEGTQDIPTESSIENKVYKSKAGHLIEIDNTDGSERISIKHKTGSKIVFNSDGTVSIIASNIKLNA